MWAWKRAVECWMGDTEKAARCGACTTARSNSCLLEFCSFISAFEHECGCVPQKWTTWPVKHESGNNDEAKPDPRNLIPKNCPHAACKATNGRERSAPRPPRNPPSSRRPEYPWNGCEKRACAPGGAATGTARALCTPLYRRSAGGGDDPAPTGGYHDVPPPADMRLRRGGVANARRLWKKAERKTWSEWNGDRFSWRNDASERQKTPRNVRSGRRKSRARRLATAEEIARTAGQRCTAMPDRDGSRWRATSAGYGKGRARTDSLEPCWASSRKCSDDVRRGRRTGYKKRKRFLLKHGGGAERAGTGRSGRASGPGGDYSSWLRRWRSWLPAAGGAEVDGGGRAAGHASADRRNVLDRYMMPPTSCGARRSRGSSANVSDRRRITGSGGPRLDARGSGYYDVSAVIDAEGGDPALLRQRVTRDEEWSIVERKAGSILEHSQSALMSYRQRREDFEAWLTS